MVVPRLCAGMPMMSSVGQLGMAMGPMATFG